MTSKLFTIDQDRFSNLPLLRHGSHKEGNEMCVMEAITWVTHKEWSDHPPCVCPVIGAFMRSWNDGLPTDEDRTRLLKPLIPRIINTKGSADLERRRAAIAADWLIGEHTVAWLRLAKLDDAASSLANLPEITDFAQCPSLMPVLKIVKGEAAAAWAAARDAARDAARAALKPTQSMLQQSALRLVERMIDAT